MEFTSNFSPLQLFPLPRHGGPLQPPRITSSEIQPSCTAISQIRSSFRAAPRRARAREKNTSQRWKARRNEEVNGVTQCRRTILADKSFFESTHGRIDPPSPSPSLLDSSKRRAHSGMESLSTVTHGVARFFSFRCAVWVSQKCCVLVLLAS